MEYQEVTPGAPREVPRGPRELGVVRSEATPARIYLQPIASPWTLGLMGLGAISFALGSYWAGWYGRIGSPALWFPFILLLGGLVQLLAGMWSFRARDTIGAVALTTWGAFFLGYGVLNWLFVNGTFPAASFRELGLIFFVVSAITLSAAIAAASENLALMLTLVGLTASGILLGIGQQLQVTTWLHAGGWVLFATSLAAWYTATAMMLESSFGRVMLPVGKFSYNIDEGAVNVGAGEPGVVRHMHPDLRPSDVLDKERREHPTTGPTPAVQP